MRVAKNQEEFKRIYEKFFEHIYKFIYLTVKTQQDSADIAQDVFYKLFVTEKDFTDDEHVKAWLYTCSKNASIDFFRKKERKHVEFESLKDIGEEMESDETLPLILQMKDKYKQPLILYYYEGYKTEEIADILGVAHSTIRIQLKRARELLKSKLTGGARL